MGKSNVVVLLHAVAVAVDLPLFDCLVHVDFDGADGVLGAGLHLPVHLPLGVLRLGLEQVHPLLGFNPAKGEKKRGGRVLDGTIYVWVRGCRPVCR